MLDAEFNVVAANAALVRITGATPDCLTDEIQTSLAGEGAWRGEISLRLSDGAILRAVASFSAVWNEHGEFVHFVGVISESTNLAGVESLVVANALRTALAEDQLALVYQPRVELATQRVVGVEALLRWNHPQLGAVSPEQFIPVAEQAGLIDDIGEWALRTACTDAAGWGELQVAVNISAHQLARPGFVGRLAAILETTGLPAGNLILEITESILIQDTALAERSFKQLKEIGVRIALDDFGTGYSSLSYLKRLTIDELKLDRAFITELPDDEDSAGIVAAIIAVARSLRLRTVAEGVETEAQLEFLRAAGCDEVQGFLIAEPVPASAVADQWHRSDP